ncbi:hypothetical protein [Halogeometricum limi]|uniref:Uncharacterized protein n=1 Tax=Halogeometricum limi TaxID=555875 RepID=A0A1I6HHT2_9EURY|nr:hypothetical protein [Halogeometricum limi]SFR53857.1 hypothetical protein SAMN04488124_2246 [Halogeometricum limi]
MGTLVLDIETASPFEEPKENETEYFEWLSVAVAFVGDDGETDTEVLFRRGDWRDEHTADLLDRLVLWCAERDIDRTLTYNGARFDVKHLVNWAASLEAKNVRRDAVSDLLTCFPHHVDVAKAAADVHEAELWDEQVVLPDWKAYQLEGIDNDTVWYRDYDFNPDFFEQLGIDDRMVKGAHVGRVLGERYVDGVAAGLHETRTHRELRRLLTDYSLSDVVDLFRLYESLGGAQLDETYHYPADAVTDTLDRRR